MAARNQGRMGGTAGSRGLELKKASKELHRYVERGGRIVWCDCDDCLKLERLDTLRYYSEKKQTRIEQFFPSANAVVMEKSGE